MKHFLVLGALMLTACVGVPRERYAVPNDGKWYVLKTSQQLVCRRDGYIVSISVAELARVSGALVEQSAFYGHPKRVGQCT